MKDKSLNVSITETKKIKVSNLLFEIIIFLNSNLNLIVFLPYKLIFLCHLHLKNIKKEG